MLGTDGRSLAGTDPSVVDEKASEKLTETHRNVMSWSWKEDVCRTDFSTLADPTKRCARDVRRRKERRSIGHTIAQLGGTRGTKSQRSRESGSRKRTPPRKIKSGREASHSIRSVTSAGKKVTSDDNVGHRKSTQLVYMPAGGARDLITSSGAR